MMKKIEIYNVFLYLTEKCNLNCRYCFFKNKRGRSVDFVTIKHFVDFIAITSINTPISFIISGGEPLLCWNLVKKTAKYIRSKFKNIKINIQTNGIYLDKNKLLFIRNSGINIEVGLDGDFITTSTNRKLINKNKFSRLIKNIQRYIKEGVCVSCNMTVHPNESNKLYNNFNYLKSIGLKSIDITPAAVREWNYRNASLFKKEYLKIVTDKENRSFIYKQEYSTFNGSISFDLSLLPTSYILCGDVFLCLNENLKKKLNLFNFERMEIEEKRLAYFIKSYKSFFAKFNKSCFSYCDYICASFLMVNKICKDINVNFPKIIELLRFISKIQSRLIIDNGGQSSEYIF